MRRPRVYIPGPLAGADELELTGDRAHYLGRVLRMRPGDPCLLFDGSGNDYPATVTTLSRHAVSLALGAPVAVATESPLPVHLLLAVTRGGRMDVALQKSVELGAAAIAPVLTARCGVRLDPAQAEKRLSHWSGVVTSAAEQCGRARLPALHAPVPLAAALEALPSNSTRLVLDPVAVDTLDTLPPPAGTVVVLAGPEGGLASEERAGLGAHGFRGIRLGPRVLRAETAPLAVLAAIQTLWGDFTGAASGPASHQGKG